MVDENSGSPLPLQEHLIFTVCLSYQYSGLEDTVEEKQEVNVGKPLIAKLDIHRDLSSFQTCFTCGDPSSASTVAGHYPSSQDLFCGAYQSPLDSPSHAAPADNSHCSRTAGNFASRHQSHHYSCPFGRSNVPVETTDEIPFSFSEQL